MQQQVQKVGLAIPEFCYATGLGRSKVYECMKEGLIRYVKAGRRTIIIDSPADFLARLAEKAA